jgi:hypothetical protein
MQSLKLPRILTPANPIVNAEFHHQRFVIQRGRVGFIWIILAGVMVLPALLISLAYIIGAFLSPIFPQASEVVSLALGAMPSALWLAIMTVAMYPVVTLVTFGLSANSVRREKTGHTWDHLRLTELNPQQIVIGKWWASLRALNGDHGMVMVLRFGFSAAFVMVLHDMIITPFGLPAEWTILPLLLIITAIFSFLDAGLTAALGIVGAMVDVGGPTVPFILFVARVFTAVAALGLWLGTLFVIPMGILFITLISVFGFISYALVIALTLRVAQKLVG